MPGKSAPTVLCCYANLNPETEKRLRAYVPWVVLEDVSDSEFAYAAALERYWGCPGDLIVIEQDMGITNEVVPSFTNCNEDWCSYQYKGPNPNPNFRYAHSLGCTKFSEAFRNRWPFSKVRELSPDGVDWYNIDGLLWYQAAYKGGEDTHVHGEVDHFHDYSDLDFSSNACPPTGFMETAGGVHYLYEINEDGTRGKLAGTIDALSEAAEKDHQSRSVRFRPLHIGKRPYGSR